MMRASSTGCSNRYAGMGRDELIQRRAGRDQHGERRPGPPARLGPSAATCSRSCPGSRRARPRTAARCRCRAPARSSPRPRAPSRCAAPPRCAAARSGDSPARYPQIASGSRRWRRAEVPQIRGQQFRPQARPREVDRLDAPLEQFLGERDRLPDGVAPDAEGLIDDRRIVHGDRPLAGRRAALVEHGHRTADEARGVLSRVADRGRAADEPRRAAVEPADAEQAAQHVGQVRAEHAPVVVQLVQHDVLQILEQPQPLRVVRQDRGVQHVGVRHDDVAGRADRPPRVARRVAVVGERADAGAERRDDLLQLIDLVGAERFRREQIQRPRSASA